MLLSILMIVKNEQKNLDKILKALKPIKDRISTELIILDTGSTDKSIDIARIYTDKVYESEWDGNFANMRNKVISYAKGEWILMVDADEELIDYEELIRFLNSDIHKNYNSASIKIRNIHSEDKSKYTLLNLVRLFRNTKDFKYVGSIHEQPKYEKPIYNNIATFNHYGYMFIDEELKQKKFKRNRDLLLLQLQKNEDDPYVNYQLASTYIFGNYNQEAVYYMEKAYDIYKKYKKYPPYIYSGLASLYLDLNEYKKCEYVCLKYIEIDNKNTDIYYYLGYSQQKLNKLEDSLANFKRYMFLLNNYEHTTQSNDLRSECNTIAFKNNIEIEIIKTYYKLDDFEEVLNRCKNLNIKDIKKVYYEMLMSLYKLEKINEILDLYKNTISSEIEKNEFILSLEHVLLNQNKHNKYETYKLLTESNDNYSILNNIRTGKAIDVDVCNRVLKEEKYPYYGEIIYKCIKKDKNIDLVELLNDVDILSMKNYFDYIVGYKRDCILDLYEYMERVQNTLSLNKLAIYKSISKSLFIGGGLKKEKYEKIFYMYINYSYDYLKQVYNDNLSDEELSKLISDEDDKFIIRFINIQNKKIYDKLNYIRSMKKILIENPLYKEIIEIEINNFKKEINESDEIIDIKRQYKILIEKDINEGQLIEAKNKIFEYEQVFGKESKILNFKAIIDMLMGDFKSTDNLLRDAFLLNRYNYDVVFNIACIKEALGEYNEAIKFLNFIVKNSTDEKLVLEVNEKIKSIN